MAIGEANTYDSVEEAIAAPLFSRMRPGVRERLHSQEFRLDEWPRWQAWLSLPDGSQRLIETMYTKVQYQGSTAWCATMRDLNGDEESAIALRESEERFRVVFNSSPVGMALKDANNLILATNPAMQALFGRSNEELAGTPFSDYWAPGFSTRRRYQKLVSGEVGDLDVQGQYVRPNGELIWAKGVQSTVSDDDGNFMYSIQVFEDITERKVAELALLASEKRFRVLFELAPIGLVLKDQNGRVLMANPATQAIFGRTQKELHLKQFRSFRPVGAPRRNERAYERLVRGELESITYERQWERKDLSLFWARGIQTAVHADDENSAYVIEAFQDITDQKEWEHTRQQLIWRLVESKEEQSRHVARELHDEIGQELTGLKLLIEARTKKSLDSATGTVDRVMQRIRYMTLDLRPAALDDLGLLAALDAQIARFSEQTNIAVKFKQRGLKRRYLPDLETVAYRIIQEALTNIARHAGVGAASISVVAENGVMRLSVEDHGAGMAPLESLRGVASSGISGMRERALSLGGSVDIQSAPGEGTIVTATIPIPAS
jgi:PAS domain S-box-containing protein